MTAPDNDSGEMLSLERALHLAGEMYRAEQRQQQERDQLLSITPRWNTNDILTLGTATGDQIEMRGREMNEIARTIRPAADFDAARRRLREHYSCRPEVADWLLNAALATLTPPAPAALAELARETQQPVDRYLTPLRAVEATTGDAERPLRTFRARAAALVDALVEWIDRDPGLRPDAGAP